MGLLVQRAIEKQSVIHAPLPKPEMFLVSCHMCAQTKNVANTSLIRNAKWAGIQCSNCSVCRRASKWECECGIPWHQCTIHRKTGMACRSDVQAAKHKFVTLHKSHGLLAESPYKHRRVTSLRIKMRDIDVGTIIWENPERLEHNKSVNESMRHNAAQQFVSPANFPSAINSETSPVSLQEHSHKRKVGPEFAVQDTISTSRRLKLYLSEEQISSYQRKRQLSVGAGHASPTCHNTHDMERFDKRRANAAPFDDNLHVKRFCPNYRWRDELDMPMILAGAPSLAIKFPSLASGRPPDNSAT